MDSNPYKSPQYGERPLWTSIVLVIAWLFILLLAAVLSVVGYAVWYETMYPKTPCSETMSEHTSFFKEDGRRVVNELLTIRRSPQGPSESGYARCS